VNPLPDRAVTQVSALKADLRKRLKALRDGMPVQDRLRASNVITHELLALGRYKAARSVLAYMSFGSEFATDEFVRHVLADSKTLALPRIERTRNRLELFTVRDLDTELTEGPWGIKEPRPEVCERVAISAIDFVLVPGLGFTVRGDRLGYGAGYYDRLLANSGPNSALVAAAFSIQMLSAMPVTAADLPVHMVLTEAGIFKRPRLAVS
jgi:5,10-methenyltetrahydrofolate synthetase